MATLKLRSFYLRDQVLNQIFDLANGAFREFGASLFAINTYPLGPLLHLRQKKAVPHLDLGLNPRPILLVHGLIHNSSAFVTLSREMKAQGWENVFSLNYKTRHGSLTAMVQEVSERVEKICAETHCEQVDIIAHSLGGIVSRYYMSLGEGRGRVKNLVTLGTPHCGTNLSFLLRGFSLGALDVDLKINSYLINLLNKTPLPRGSTLTSIFAKYDWTVWPRENCLVKGLPRQAFHNIEINDTGHMGLLYSGEVAELAMKALLA